MGLYKIFSLIYKQDKINFIKQKQHEQKLLQGSNNYWQMYPNKASPIKCWTCPNSFICLLT